MKDDPATQRPKQSTVGEPHILTTTASDEEHSIPEHPGERDGFTLVLTELYQTTPIHKVHECLARWNVKGVDSRTEPSAFSTLSLLQYAAGMKRIFAEDFFCKDRPDCPFLLYMYYIFYNKHINASHLQKNG